MTQALRQPPKVRLKVLVKNLTETQGLASGLLFDLSARRRSKHPRVNRPCNQDSQEGRYEPRKPRPSIIDAQGSDTPECQRDKNDELRLAKHSTPDSLLPTTKLVPHELPCHSESGSFHR